MKKIKTAFWALGLSFFLQGAATLQASDILESASEPVLILEKSEVPDPAPAPTPNTSFKKVILTLDGGGVRGLFQALFLRHLEERVRSLTKVKDLKIGECIDFIAGTSTGAITGGLLAFPDPENPHKPKYDAHYFVSYYEENIHKVFSQSLLKSVVSMGGLLGKKYSDDGFMELLTNLFKDTPLKQACIPLIMTSFELSNKDRGSRPYLFNSHPIEFKKIEETPLACTAPDKGEDLYNVSFKGAIRASGAAPTYFERYKIRGKQKEKKEGKEEKWEKHYFVDGGLSGANNPANIGYTWATNYFDSLEGEEKIKKKDFFLLSMGTGKAPLMINGHQSKRYGLLEWAPNLIPMLLNSPSMLTEDTMQGIFPSNKYGDNYRRFQPILEASIDLADASEEALKTIRQEANLYIIENINDFEHVAAVLASRYRAKRAMADTQRTEEDLLESILMQ